MRRTNLQSIVLGIAVSSAAAVAVAQIKASGTVSSAATLSAAAAPTTPVQLGGSIKTKDSLLASKIAGDANGDGVVNYFDLEPFGMAVAEPERYAKTYPDVNPLNLDIDGDGRLTNFDIDPFVAMLVPAPIRPAPTVRIAGDANCDGALNNFDIDAFVMALIDADRYAVLHGACDVGQWDPDGDGRLTNFDMGAMSELIVKNGS